MNTERNCLGIKVLLASGTIISLCCGLLPYSYAQTTPIDCLPNYVPILVTRVYGKVLPPLPIQPDPEPQSLPVPGFSPQNGSVAFGSMANLSASVLPPGAVLEYSTDNGATWVTGSQITITNRINVVGRVRLNQQTSASVNVTFSPYFERMLVIGNSIMSHGPAPDLGWFNNNGMAASAPEKDFVHLLTANLQTLYAPVAVKLQSSGGIERQYGMADYSIDEFNDPVQEFKPDLILVRMGENVDDSQVIGRNFELYFRQFLERLASLSQNQPVKIVCTTSSWSNPQADAIIRNVTNEKGYTLVDLSRMVGKSQYVASQYANNAVAAHPNDAGMQLIADLIWEKLK